MIALLVVSVIFGAVVSGLTGIGVLFWLAGGAVFVCGLPFALVSSFIRGEIAYAQDRADYRQAVSEIAAAERAEDARIESSKPQTNIYNDNRQIRLYRGNYDEI
jgi:hypothetical protein